MFQCSQFGTFYLVDAETLRKTVTELKPCTCCFDPIPASIFNIVSEDILAIVTHSLQLGVGCDFKTAFVREPGYFNTQ